MGWMSKEEQIKTLQARRLHLLVKSSMAHTFTHSELMELNWVEERLEKLGVIENLEEVSNRIENV